jgi:hypothetical protein
MRRKRHVRRTLTDSCQEREEASDLRFMTFMTSGARTDAYGSAASTPPADAGADGAANAEEDSTPKPAYHKTLPAAPIPTVSGSQSAY